MSYKTLNGYQQRHTVGHQPYLEAVDIVGDISGIRKLDIYSLHNCKQLDNILRQASNYLTVSFPACPSEA